MSLKRIHRAIASDPDNKKFTDQGWSPIYTAHQDARILIIGQAPGRIAQASGIPWNDASGNNLRAWMNIDRDTFYNETKIALVPMDFYFPGSKGRGDIPPRKEFAPQWHPPILDNLPNIQLTLLIGTHAQAHYLKGQRKSSLTATVQAFEEYLPKYLPLVHPSPRNNIWQKKNPWFKKKTIPFLQKKVEELILKPR